MVKGYCLKEKKHIEVVDPVYDINARGSPLVRGTCPSCKGKINTMISYDSAPPNIKAKADAFKRNKSGSARQGSAKKRSAKSASAKKRAPKRK